MSVKHFRISIKPFLLITSVLLLGSSAALIADASVQAHHPVKSGEAKPAVKSPKAATSAKGPWVIKSTVATVSLPEFEQAYRRMNDKDPYATTLDSLKEFLNVYADYRLKLADAQKEGLDKDPKIVAEIKGYRQMLAGPYLLDKEVTDPAIHELYNRRMVEVHAGHFLAAIHNQNDPADTLRAYKRAMDAINRLNNGESMTLVTLNPGYRSMLADENNKPLIDKGKLAAGADTSWQGSDDKGSARNGGDLGFFTGGMTVRPFEDAAYSLKPGEITKYPVRTRFGYHVIEVYERIPRIGGVKVSHIFVQMPDVTTDTTAYYHKIDSLYRAVKNGANFEQVARESSEDKKTAALGGDMGYINREDHRAPLQFDHAAYALKDGEISGIVRTNIGYHIIKRTATIPIKTYDQEKDNLKTVYKRYYFNEDRDKKLAVLKTKYNLKVDSSTINYFIAHIDSSRTSLDSNWTKKLDKSDRQRVIYSLGGDRWTINSLIDSLNAQPGAPLARNTLLDLINKRIDDNTLDLGSRNIAEKYPEFDQIMQDYKNGIILFELENQRVWSKVVPDSLQELKYYQQHHAKFLWPERVDISEIFVTSDSLAKSLYKRIISGENFDTLAKKYTERPGFKDKAGRWGLMQKDENELSGRAFTFVAGEVKEPFSFQGGYSIVRLNQRDPIHEKTFDEARQEVASQYQDDRASELRTQWVTELRKTYKRQLNEALLTQAWEKNHVAQASVTGAPAQH